MFIAGDARRSSPCVVFMPQIEDWVLEIEHETPTGSPDVQEHSKLGKADDAATSWISNGGLATSLEQENVSTSKVSIFWKVMKQQLQTMPPDTPLMLLVGFHVISPSPLCCSLLAISGYYCIHEKSLLNLHQSSLQNFSVTWNCFKDSDTMFDEKLKEFRRTSCRSHLFMFFQSGYL